MKSFLSYLLPSLAVGLLLGWTSCQNQSPLPYKEIAPELPAQALNYAAPVLPTHAEFVTKQEAWGELSDEGATLGRVLFFDKQLSINNQVACASCHQQQAAFSDVAKLSTGFEGQLTTRNSPSLVNLVNQTSYFWDSRTDKLEDLIEEPIRNHIEMGMENMEELTLKLASTSYYPPLFKAAFGSEEVSTDRIASAMTQYLNSMVTYRSRYDVAMQGGTSLTTDEQAGAWVFTGKGKCYTCHGGIDFRSQIFGFPDPFSGQAENWANIGLDEVYEDPGLGRLNEAQTGVFKVPSLRNIALTAPYMHDGRFESLEEVIEHYNSGVHAHPNLDLRVADAEGRPQQLNLTPEEKRHLIAFLNTLSDAHLLTDERYADPFPAN